MNRVPVTIVTGFLGSGKTTLIARLLTQPGLTDTLVVVNEFGEVGIDHDLLEASSDDTILLANGCLCCTIRGNLVDTLLDVRAQMADGRLRRFDRVVVETSGVADPALLLGFLLGSGPVMAHYRADAVVTTVDAVAGRDILARQHEAAVQVGVADRLLLTKTDLATPDTVESLAHVLRELNPVAPLVHVLHGDISATRLLDPNPRQQVAAPAGHGHCDDRESGHTERFCARVLWATSALSRAQIAEIENAIRVHMDARLLRLKAILPVREGGSAILHAAPMTVHPAEFQESGRDAGRLVLITEGAAPTPLIEALLSLGLEPSPS